MQDAAFRVRIIHRLIPDEAVFFLFGGGPSMFSQLKRYIPRRRFKDLLQLIMDFTKKCNEDHITAFGAMSAFFILLSFIPFMIFFLTLAKFLPFSKNDIQQILTQLLTFESNSVIINILNELYHKTGYSVFTLSIVLALWSSSKGIYSIVKGLNSVYDIEDDRNFFVLRFFSLIYTLIFTLVIIAMLLLWVFGHQLYHFVDIHFQFLASLVAMLINQGSILTFFVLLIIFMWIYCFIPNRKSNFFHQYPGAIVASLGWILVSKICAYYVDHFSNFTYIYGSMAGIMILLTWMYFCMSMIFYGAEVNYFLENKKNYHTLIRIFRPNFRQIRREKEQELKKEEKEKAATP